MNNGVIIVWSQKKGKKRHFQILHICTPFEVWCLSALNSHFDNFQTIVIYLWNIWFLWMLDIRMPRPALSMAPVDQAASTMRKMDEYINVGMDNCTELAMDIVEYDKGMYKVWVLVHILCVRIGYCKATNCFYTVNQPRINYIIIKLVEKNFRISITSVYIKIKVLILLKFYIIFCFRIHSFN